MKNFKLPKAALIAICLLLIVGSAFFIIKRQSGKNIPVKPLTPKINYSLKPSFHPDSVISIKWQMNDKSYYFQRKNRSHPWSPEGPSSKIQKQLNLLSMLHQDGQLKLGSKRPVKIELSFSNNTVWKGDWDGEIFKWVSGPFQGKGARLVGIFEGLYFAEEDFVYNQEPLRWCTGRFSNVEISAPKKLTIALKEYSWTHSLLPNKSKEVSTFMEKWMGKNCKIKSEFKLPSSSNLRELILSKSYIFSGGDFKDPVEIDLYSNGISKLTLVGGPLWIFSPGFAIELQNLIDPKL